MRKATAGKPSSRGNSHLHAFLDVGQILLINGNVDPHRAQIRDGEGSGIIAVFLAECQVFVDHRAGKGTVAEGEGVGEGSAGPRQNGSGDLP